MGIVTSGSIWASDVAYMNDHSELSYAAGIIDGVVQEEIEAGASPELRELLTYEPGDATSRIPGAADPYIACFCEEGDLLSQWRGYGVGKTGASLGMDLTSIVSTFQLPPQTFLRKVIYQEAEQKRLTSVVVQRWLRTLETLLSSLHQRVGANSLRWTARKALREALVEHHLCFKHPGFEEEREWRLIMLVDVNGESTRREKLRSKRQYDELAADLALRGIPFHKAPRDHISDLGEGVNIKFREGPMALVPYVEIRLRQPAGVRTGRLPLTHVRQGPTENAELASESLSSFLRLNGYGRHTEVRHSEIPLRR